MITREAQSKGGKVTAAILKKDALERYYANPNICKHCNSTIDVRDNQRVADARRKQFCNHSCSQSYYNSRRYRKRWARMCPGCNGEITSRAKVCRSCYVNSLIPISSLTKAELRERRPSYQSFRSGIRNHAVGIFRESNRPYICQICSYDLHVDICHKKPVAEFSDDTIIAKINDINNLIALCPNHHWELDNDILILSK